MTTAKLSPTKRALLIGNDEYEVQKLSRCKNDAEDVANTLKKIGFKTVIGCNLTYIGMTDLIKDFLKEIVENDFVIFFFSGHGTEWQGKNYLIPINNKCLVERPDRHQQHAVIIQEMLKSMSIKKPFILVCLLDCCRISIEDTKALLTKSDSTSVTTINGPLGCYIVFACGPDQVTFDTSPDNRHSLFTYHLLKHIAEPNLKIDDMMCRVCEGVYTDSNGQIYAHRSSSLRTSEVYFKTTTKRQQMFNDQSRKIYTDSKTTTTTLSNFSKIQSSSIENFSQIVNIDGILTLIVKGITLILELEDNEEKDRIIVDLLKNGRQSLTQYKDKIADNKYAELMNGNNNQLMKFLKSYFEQQWKLQLGLSNECFALFLKEYQNNENVDIYEYILTRTAEYGNIYMNNCPILSIVLQFLFEGIDDQCLKETHTFNDLWSTITNDGLRSITKYSEYIIPDILDEQINKKQPILFQALREYYRPELYQLLIQSNITNRQNLYELVLDNVAEHGWSNGLTAIQKKILAKNFTILLKNFHSFRQQPHVITDVHDITTLSNDKQSLSTLIEIVPRFQNTPGKTEYSPYDGFYKDITESNRAIVFYTRGEQYIGDWHDDKRNGYGLNIEINGDQYVGFFQDDKKHGHGEHICVNGETYVGDWINGQRNGYGIYTGQNSEKYEGFYMNDKKHGKGTFIFVTGEKYVGDWINDMQTGHGTYTWPNNEQYIGAFENNRKHGRGTFIDTNGEKYDGIWIDDKRQRQGTNIKSNGDKHNKNRIRNRRRISGCQIS